METQYSNKMILVAWRIWTIGEWSSSPKWRDGGQAHIYPSMLVPILRLFWGRWENRGWYWSRNGQKFAQKLSFSIVFSTYVADVGINSIFTNKNRHFNKF